MTGDMLVILLASYHTLLNAINKVFCHLSSFELWSHTKDRRFQEIEEVRSQG